MNHPPLWLPVGSVRALLAIMIVVRILWAIEPTESPNVEYIGILALVLHYYFKVRGDEAGVSDDQPRQTPPGQ